MTFFFPGETSRLLDRSGLDDVDWVALGGPDADRVPSALRTVAPTEDLGDPYLWDQAHIYLEKVGGYAYEEQLVPTPVTEHLIPFFEVVVLDPEVYDRDALVECLREIALSHRRAPHAQPGLGLALEDLVPFAVGLFADPDRRVRQEAFQLVTELPLKGRATIDTVVGALEDRVAADEPEADPGAVEALTELRRRHGTGR
ncbi:hypothetical protein IDM40_16315 [Nocardiopsis sp. HNM0947]|uniref:HEAT repeat domain-containing protein n=1 Tax=Nocardiopsis coralli TaxID=2772213 RepID=A0ABR9P8T0_9ACTN|nr:hypothetical protein [Nocardiopsis coralli]MBE3000253.1 hypothetical protein [Nocardiopsis coralli]